MDALTFRRQDHKSVVGTLETLDDAPSGSGTQMSDFETTLTNVIAASQREAVQEQYFWAAVAAALDDEATTGRHIQKGMQS